MRRRFYHASWRLVTGSCSAIHSGAARVRAVLPRPSTASASPRLRETVPGLETMARHRAPVRQMTSQRLHIGQTIAHDALTHTMAAGTGPVPVWCILNNLRGNRSAFYISHSDHQLRVVHRVAGKARLEKMPAPAFAKVDLAGITPMCLCQHCAQAVSCFRHQHEMNLCVHQASG